MQDEGARFKLPHHGELTMMINSGYSHISEPAQVLHSRAPSVGGNITAQSVQSQREIPEESKKKNY